MFNKQTVTSYKRTSVDRIMQPFLRLLHALAVKIRGYEGVESPSYKSRMASSKLVTTSTKMSSLMKNVTTYNVQVLLLCH